MNFTIVTSSYNHGPKIRKCIESVLVQNGEFDIEYIIFDNNSQDETADILREYQQKFNDNSLKYNCRNFDLKIISQGNTSQAEAISECFNMAKNEILSWINTDDEYEPGALKIVYDNFKRQEADIIFGNGSIINSINKTITLTNVQKISSKKMFLLGNHIFQPAVFFKKESYRKHPIKTDIEFLFDYDLWLNFIEKEKCLWTKDRLAKFYVWPKSKTNINKKEFFIDNKMVIRNNSDKFSKLTVHLALIRTSIQYHIQKISPNIYKKIRDFIRRAKSGPLNS